ncbi:MAG: cytochrome c maturation protein CcmE [Chloroflexi bacterium]|nr:cytochrome c maturation protein CcmE [Chloroflexota bacterium]
MSRVTIPDVEPDKSFLPRQTKLLLGAFIILAAIGFFAFTTSLSTQQYYLTLPELVAKGDLATKQPVRVIGNLVPDTTRIDSKQISARFTIYEGDIKLPVYYKGILPDTFEKATQVIAEGTLGTDGVFQANLVLAKCPSKYDPSQVEWYSATKPGDLNYATGK